MPSGCSRSTKAANSSNACFFCHIADKSGHLPASLTHLFHLCESGLLILVYKIYTIPLRSKMCDDARPIPPAPPVTTIILFIILLILVCT